MKSGSTPTIVATEVPAVRSRLGVDGDDTGADRPLATVCSDLSRAFDPDRSFALTFEALPCMAMIERKGYIVARNRLARRMTGYTDPMADTTDGCNASPESSQVDHVLVGAYDFRTNERRLRFDCLAMRRHGAPMQVNAASERIVLNGEPCTLLLLMEYAEGFAGATRSEGSFLEDVLDATPEATAITHEGRVLHFNREFSRLFGYSLAECVGQDLDELVVPDGRLHETEIILHTLRTVGRASIETVRKTRSGEAMDVSVLVTRVRLGGDALGMVVTYRDIRKQKREEARLQHKALHDVLTGLANRALFLDRVRLTLSRLKRRPDRLFAVIFLDLDGFKQVNDTLGHAAGDRLLAIVADRLTACLRPQDTVARFGGDEFALLLDESAHVSEVVGIAERIQVEIQRVIQLEGNVARVSASIGIALATPEYETAERIMNDADAAMYQAKAGGKARHVIFTHKLPAPEI